MKDKKDQGRVTRAVELLSEELGELLRGHPGGHLIAGRGGGVSLELRLPVAPREGELGRIAEEAAARMADELGGMVLERAVFRPGRVWCLRCASAECEHSAPATHREVFTGYGPTGIPRFAELGAWMLKRGDERVHLLYGDSPKFLAHTATGAELTRDLLDAYREGEEGYRLHGQVVAGWYRGPGPQGHPELVAVTLQIASTQARGKKGKKDGGARRYGLNVVGLGPEGEDLIVFCDRLDAIPWAGPVRWAQKVLEEIGASRKKGGEEARQRRIDGLLRGLAARLEKDQRAHGRRTRHARERHDSGKRPTRMAVADLRRASEERILVDTRQDTLVVLGDRGRAHVFNRRGKLVTSIRYQQDAIEKRKKQGRWRPARPEEAASLRTHVAEADGAA